METNEIPPTSEFHIKQGKLRTALFENDIDTYYAVESHGHSMGWSGALFSLKDRIRDRIDHFQEVMNNPDIHPETLQELLHAQNGIFAVSMMIDELQK